MTYANSMPASLAAADQRSRFLRLTYLHLGLAVLAFATLEAFLITSGLAATIAQTVLGARFGWLMLLGGFMAVGWIAERWASNLNSVPLQYLGLGVYVVAEAILFAPLLLMATLYGGPELIPTAALMTAILFTGLTGTVMLTGKDFSFMGKFLAVAGFGALGLIACALIFGFPLGLWFSFAMVVLAGGYILYYTSNVLHRYPVGSHVAASLALFASVALLFWYVLRILMMFSSRD